MKLHQLRYLAAVVDNGMNISLAAQRLHTSQPGISKQIKLLEDELGFQIFRRDGKTLTGLTPAGMQVVSRATRILREVKSINGISEELRDDRAGRLRIATTHTQARYVLPKVVQGFRHDYPDVKLDLHQGTSEQIADMVAKSQVDLAIATGAQDLFPNMVLLPCYRWQRILVVPKDHPLAGEKQPTLEQLAAHPIVTYVFSFHGPSSLLETFRAVELEPDVACTARDSDVLKTYVRLGLGVGIIANMAYEPEVDGDLVRIEAGHLLSDHVTWIGFPRASFLRGFAYDFIHLLAPHLDRDTVERAAAKRDQSGVEAMFSGTKLPQR